MLWELWLTGFAIVVLGAVLLWDTLRKPTKQPPPKAEDDPQTLLEHDPHREAKELLNSLKDKVKHEKEKKRQK
jgi:cytochrome c-type biogenesis protein CcmH/NrfF